MKYPGPLSVESAKIYFHVLSFKQKDDHTCYIIKHSKNVLVPYDKVKPRSGTDKWKGRMEQTNCTKMVGAYTKPHFSEDGRVFMVLKYTEIGNVLKRITKKGFKGSF